jgi:aspartokinase/homoserine dehydrogenase 1
MWSVHKFGGTSLAHEYCFKQVVRIILSDSVHASSEKKLIVVSAMGEIKKNGIVEQILKKESDTIFDYVDKVTNMLVQATSMAQNNTDEWHDIINTLIDRHYDLIKNLGINTSSLVDSFDSDFMDLCSILRTVQLNRDANEKGLRGCWWFGFGEIWSARILTDLLNAQNHNNIKAEFLDSREVLFLLKEQTLKSGNVVIDYKKSKEQLDLMLNNINKDVSIIVTTGYICSDYNKSFTTLGRDGSDYSASIFGSLLDAKFVSIYTDVDGVYTANPAQIKNAKLIPNLTYEEAGELAYFGAKVIHPKTMIPVIIKQIPILIKNTFNPNCSGTCISANNKIVGVDMDINIDIKSAINVNDDKTTILKETNLAIKGITEISNLSIIKVEGNGMIGIAGLCSRLFKALADHDISVVFITQASSEHSVCFAVLTIFSQQCLTILKTTFEFELKNTQIHNIDALDNCSCIAIVGENMIHTVGLAAKFFTAVSETNTNIIAIAQGSSERNISICIHSVDVIKVMKNVHAKFF